MEGDTPSPLSWIRVEPWKIDGIRCIHSSVGGFQTPQCRWWKGNGRGVRIPDGRWSRERVVTGVDDQDLQQDMDSRCSKPPSKCRGIFATNALFYKASAREMCMVDRKLTRPPDIAHSLQHRLLHPTNWQNRRRPVFDLAIRRSE